MRRRVILRAGAIAVAALVLYLIVCNIPLVWAVLDGAGITGGPILTFDGDEASARLKEDMDAGRIPVSCTIREANMLPEDPPDVIVINEQEIRELYDRLAQIQVGRPTELEVTCSAFYDIEFELQDGTTAMYEFESRNTLQRREPYYTTYAISGQDDLWDYVDYLREHTYATEN